MNRAPFFNGGMGEIPQDARFDIPEAPHFGKPPHLARSKGGAALSDKMSSWSIIPITAGLNVIKLQEYTLRKFMLIQNLDAVGTLFFGFGWSPSLNFSLRIGPGEGYEPFAYPTNEIYVLGSAASVSGVLIVGV